MTSERLPQAFPLLQTCDPTLSLETWTRFAEPLLAAGAANGKPPEQGILSVENEQGYITALFTYRSHDDLRLGRVLMAENFLAFDLLDPGVCARALVEALEQLCLQLGCKAVRSLVTLPETPGDKNGSLMAAVLSEMGHRDCGRLLSKDVSRLACRKS